MGDEERLDVGAALLEVGDVGDDEVDAEHLLVGEHQAAVDDDDVVAVLEHVHVLADLAHPAERDDPERLVVVGRWHRFPWLVVQKRVSWGVGVVRLGAAVGDGVAVIGRRVGGVGLASRRSAAVGRRVGDASRRSRRVGVGRAPRGAGATRSSAAGTAAMSA